MDLIPIHDAPYENVTASVTDIVNSFNNSAEHFFSCECGGRGDSRQRHIYRLLGKELCVETYFPWNPFKKTTVSYDWNVVVRNTSVENALAERHNGYLTDAAIYSDDETLRYAVFKTLEDAVTYLLERKTIN